MTYDFDSFIDRSKAGSSKWTKMQHIKPDTPSGIIPYSIADMEFKTAPEIVDGLKEYLDSAILGYTVPHDAYRNAVAHWMNKRHGWHIDPAWILSTPGIVQAMYHAVRTFTNAGDGVIVMTPVYYPMYHAIEQNGRVIVRNPLINTAGRYEIDFDALEQAAKKDANKLLLFCSPHNPVGRVWTRAEVERVGKICLAHGVLVLSDEIHCDLILSGRHTSFASISEDFAQNSIVCTSVSKSFNLAGLLQSNIIIPNSHLRRKFQIEYERMASEMNHTILGFKACELAYTRAESWLDAMLEKIRENSNLVSRFVAEHLPEVIVSPLEGTYLPWLDFRAFGFPERELERIMQTKADAFLDEGYIFGPEGSGFERLNIACPTRFVLELLERIERAVRRP